MSVKEIAVEIVSREGGYVNDPSDPGGPTKYGVTLGTMKSLGLDLNHDGVINASDVRLLTVQEAVDIFLKHYFYRPHIDLLPKELQASVFDMQVNAGSNAIRILQRLLSQFHQKVAVDGDLGPATAAMVKKAWNSYFVDAYGIARRNYYFSLADQRPSLRKYARTRAGKKGGWIKRAETFISPRYRMSQEQFNIRVKSWA